MKTTLRYLLIATLLSVASLIFATAQSLAQMPEAQMRSTSSMVGSGSTLPMAATEGVYTTQSSSPAKVGPRRAEENAGTEDEDDPDNPGEPSPIGDAALPLMLAAAVYSVWSIVYRRRKRE